MTPEAAGHPDKARRFLGYARTILAAGVAGDAGRDAYLAAFHAAQALICERTGKAAKTHKGTHIQFARLTRDESRLDPELRRFLPQSYDIKAISDYETGPDAIIDPEQAAAAIATAARFVDVVVSLLSPLNESLL